MTIPQAFPERTILLVTNTDSAAHTLTVEAGDPTMGLGSAHAVAIAISAGGSAYVGPFDSAVVQQRDGSLSLDFQAGHVGTVTALLAPEGNLMAEQDVDTSITQEHVTEAEAKAREAAALVEALERQIEAGDDSVTVEELDAQEKVSRFAKLRATGMAEKAKKAREARRQAALQDLRARVDAVVADRGRKAAKLLKAIRDAEDAYLAFSDEVNAEHAGWLREADTELHVRHTNQNAASDKVDAGLAIRDAIGGLVAGDRLIQRLPGRANLEQFYKAADPEPHYANLVALDGGAK